MPLLGQLVKHNNALSCNTARSPDFNQLVDRIESKLQPGLIVNIVSDFNDLDQQTAIRLAAIASRCELSLIRVFDPLEQSINLKSQVGISNGSEIKRVKLNSSILNQYRNKRALIKQQLEEITQKSGIPLISIETQTV